MVNRQIRVARGSEPADLVFKHASVVNVFTEQVEVLDVAICQGMIVGLGTYDGLKELDCTGKYLVPGFIDGHIHLESSMMQPAEFAERCCPMAPPQWSRIPMRLPMYAVRRGWTIC